MRLLALGLLALGLAAPAGATGVFAGYPDCFAGCNGVELEVDDELRIAVGDCGFGHCHGTSAGAALPVSPPDFAPRQCGTIPPGPDYCLDL